MARPGLEQRLRALDAFVADVHGPQRIIADGVMPGRVLGGAEYYEPELAGLRPPGRRCIGVAGFDIVRDDDGVLAVLEDNLRTPSGIAYAIADARGARRDPARGGAGRRAAGRGRGRAARARRCAPRCRRPRPTRADPHDRAAHRRGRQQRPLGARLAGAGAGVPLARPADLRRAGDRVLLRTAAAGRRDLPPHGRRTARDSAARQAARARHAQGHARRGQRVRHRRRGRQARAGLRRGHGPLLPRRGAADPLRARPTTSARAFDLREALDRFEELVVKPRAGSGGRGVVICPHAKPEDVETAAARWSPTPAPGSRSRMSASRHTRR